ncbi:MAG TPA: hypothetical protein PKD28_00245 [Candidatus Saccharibacteria bacterium]|nr:hypothetical protein [Candidatus Saccharibacteria bacterium]
MNPEENQENYWQENQQQAPATDYPQEVYQPSVEEIEDDTEVTEGIEPVEVPDEVPVQWIAREYIDEAKGTGWYAIFALVAIGFIAADIFLLRSWLYTFSILVVVMAVALVVYTRRPPRDIQYTLSPQQGLYVGDRLYHLADFKAFGLIRDGEHHSIMLIPIKRFAPGVSVYFPEEVGEQIVDILGQRLPMETLKLDPIDVLIRKLRL